MRRFAPRAELTKERFWDILEPLVAGAGRVLELASGTGQHLAHFASRAPEIRWTPSERSEIWIDSIAAWTGSLDNVEAPELVEIGRDAWPAGPFDAVIALNVLHLLGDRVDALFEGAAAALGEGGVLVASGVFARDDQPAAPPALPGWGPEITLVGHEALAAAAGRAGFVAVDSWPIPEYGDNHEAMCWRRRPR